jgi:hypothetical protein
MCLPLLRYAGAYFGTTIGLPISGWLCSSPLGWPGVFYVAAASGAVWWVLSVMDLW